MKKRLLIMVLIASTFILTSCSNQTTGATDTANTASRYQEVISSESYEHLVYSLDYQDTTGLHTLTNHLIQPEYWQGAVYCLAMNYDAYFDQQFAKGDWIPQQLADDSKILVTFFDQIPETVVIYRNPNVRLPENSQPLPIAEIPVTKLEWEEHGQKAVQYQFPIQYEDYIELYYAVDCTWPATGDHMTFAFALRQP